MTIFENLLSISISDLRKWNYINPEYSNTGVINWYNEGEKYSSINIDISIETQSISLKYIYEGDHIHNFINIVSIPSNLGKGVLWYFKCPITHNRCRKLYLVDGYFISRFAIKNGMHRIQTKSKSWRGISQYIALEEKCNDLIDQIEMPYGKILYNGKLTKKAKKCEDMIRQLRAIDKQSVFNN